MRNEEKNLKVKELKIKKQISPGIEKIKKLFEYKNRDRHSEKEENGEKEKRNVRKEYEYDLEKEKGTEKSIVPSKKIENMVDTVESVRHWFLKHGQNQINERKQPLEKREIPKNIVRKNSTSGEIEMKRKMSEKKIRGGKNKNREKYLYSDIRDFFESKTVQNNKTFKGANQNGRIYSEFCSQKLGSERGEEDKYLINQLPGD